MSANWLIPLGVLALAFVFIGPHVIWRVMCRVASSRESRRQSRESGSKTSN